MATAPTANVVGTWSAYAGQGGAGVPVNLTLAQTGTNVTGNVTVAACPDLSGPVTGAIQGELLKLSLATATFSQLEVKGDTMTGMTRRDKSSFVAQSKASRFFWADAAGGGRSLAARACQMEEFRLLRVVHRRGVLDDAG